MLFRRVLLGLLLAIQPITVRAQMLCGDHDGIVAVLAERYGEERAAVGVTTAGAALELFVSENGETWTLLLTVPGETTCLIAAGDTWEPTPAIAGIES